jgi:predicted nucleotidyltransferase
MALFKGGASRKIALYLWLRPPAGETLGTLVKHTGIEGRTARYALDYLVGELIVNKTAQPDGFPRYAANRAHTLADDLRDLAIRTLGGSDSLVRSLVDHPDVSRVAVYGSFAKGAEHTASDIDLIVVMSRESDEVKELAWGITGLVVRIGRAVNVMTYTEAKFGADQDTTFVKNLTSGPLIVLKGVF